MSNFIPNPFAVAQKAIGAAYKTIDYGLEKSADYAEKANHVVSPVPHQTELIQGDEAIERRFHGSVAKIIEGIRLQIKRGAPITLNSQNAAALVDALLSSQIAGGEDDRLMLLEYALVALSRSPQTGINTREAVLGPSASDRAIELLWNDLPHPPSGMVGRKYRYRSADGSGTSLWDPDMGKAGSPYARTVQGTHPLPPHELPSPGLLFDTLLKRERREDHPAGLSGLFFAFANLIIHQLFWTDHFTDPSEPQNLTSSYIDLSVLYGNSQADQDTIRLRDGTGKIKADTFMDHRLLLMPPSTPALCVLFSRNHNYICQKLLEINERSEWSWPPIDALKQDEDIFQTARLINCGFFMQTILSDYLGAILGLVREGNSWSLNPLSQFRLGDKSVSPRGSGNVVSVEFAALYRFHSSISSADEKWAEAYYREIFGETSWEKIDEHKFKHVLKNFRDTIDAEKPETWTFGGLSRDIASAKFNDDDLAKILQDATASPASAFKARGTPAFMRVVECMAIEQNRRWGTCSLNEFRKFLGLKPYSTFEEWNPRSDIAEAARRLYRHPDNIELYVGLQAEESKPVIPGAGLCASYTMTRAVLSDAVALVRGDRFLTTEFTAYNLTAWGYTDAMRNPNNSANGGTLGKLLTRTLPNHYHDDSVFTHFPLMTPLSMQKNLSKIGTASKYAFGRPVAVRPFKIIKSYSEAAAILSSPAFVTEYRNRAADIMPLHGGYLLSMDDQSRNTSDRQLIVENFASSTSTKRQMEYLAKKTQNLLTTKSYTTSGGHLKCVDIVRDVINYLPVHFVADVVIGLPLKSEHHQIGTFYEQELYEKLKDVYSYIFLKTDPTTRLARQDGIKDIVGNLVRITSHHFAGFGRLLPGVNLVDTALHLISPPNHSHNWFARLQANGKRPTEQVVNDVIALAVIISVEFSQILTHVIDTLLPPSLQPQADADARDRNAHLDARLQVHALQAQIDEAKKLAGDGDPGVHNLQDQIKALKQELQRAAQERKKASDGATSARTKANEGSAARAQAIADIVKSGDRKATALLKVYIAEAIRLAPPIPGVYRDVIADVRIGETKYSKGDRLYISLLDAMRDAEVFPSGADFAPPASDSGRGALLGDGLIRLMSEEWVINMTLPVIKTIFATKNLSRVEGYSGQLNSFVMQVDGTNVNNAGKETCDEPGTAIRSYLDKNHMPTPWSSSMTISYTE